MSEFHEITAITPLDGRYHERVAELEEYVSEYALIKSRVQVEGALLIALSDTLPDVQSLDGETKGRIAQLVESFSPQDAADIAYIETHQTKHDVKAVEVWLRSKFATDPVLANYLEVIHFGVTSDDINNNAYNLMVTGANKNVIIPRFEAVVDDLNQKAYDYSDIPLLSLTHGQPATPTTLGKEMKVFASRLGSSVDILRDMKLKGKLNGATGTYGAMVYTYPDVDWPAFSRKLVEGLGFEFNGVTTQIEPHDSLVRYLNELGLANTQVIGFARDFWGYISRGVFKQIPVKGATGSSTMPQKVNPINFENAEANSKLAVGLAQTLARELPISRFQRDLSDSSMLRNVAPTLGHTAVSLIAFKRGLGSIKPDQELINAELAAEYPVLTELIQTVGRRYGEDDIYQHVKERVRGQDEMTKEAFQTLVFDVLPKTPSIERLRLSIMNPADSIGLAPQIARGEV